MTLFDVAKGAGAVSNSNPSPMMVESAAGPSQPKKNNAQAKNNRKQLKKELKGKEKEKETPKATPSKASKKASLESPKSPAPVSSIVGTKLLLGPPLCDSWCEGVVFNANFSGCVSVNGASGSSSNTAAFSYEVEIISNGEKQVRTFNMSAEEAMRRSTALRPGILTGAAVRELFDNQPYDGVVKKYKAKERFYRVVYSDEDFEDLELHEVLEILVDGLPEWSKFRSKAAQTPQKEPSNEPVPPPPAIPAAPIPDPSPQAAAALPPVPQIQQTQQLPGDKYTPCGAGNARGVQAFDKKAGCRRPIGLWITTDTMHGKQRVDFRHLDEGALPLNKPKGIAGVPGWIGVLTESDRPMWTPEYDGLYYPCLWERRLAVKVRVAVNAAGCATPQEAAKLHDRMALALYGPENAETNFPVDSSLLSEVGSIDENASQRTIYCAAKLLSLSTVIPWGAVSHIDTTEEEWGAWEQRILEMHVLKAPTVGSINALGKELAWLVLNVPLSCIMPSWRGEDLKHLIKACKECTASGRFLEHYFSADCCPACAGAVKQERTTDGKERFKHDQTSLIALLRTVEEFVFCQEAMDAVDAEKSEKEVEAAAQAAQRAFDVKLGKHVETANQGGSGGGGASEAGASRGASGSEQRKRKDISKLSSASLPKQQQQQVQVHKKQKTEVEGKRKALPAAVKAKGKEPGARPISRLSNGIVADASAAAVPLVPTGLRVVVIGGGISGVKAAADLHSLDASVTLLEARDRLGGRVHTLTLASGDQQRSVDLGSSFVCGISTDLSQQPINPLVPFISKEVGLKLIPKYNGGADGLLLFDTSGEMLCLEDQLTIEDTCSELLHDLLQRGDAEASKRGRQVEGPSVSTALGEILDSMAMMDPAERAAVETCTADMYGAPMDMISLKGSISEGYEGDHALVQGGCGQIITALAQGVGNGGGGGGGGGSDAAANNKQKTDREIEGFKKPLQDIRLSSEVYKIEMCAGGKGVKVWIKGQRLPLEAHAALVTLPIGVLQSGSIEFQPQLPPSKQEAILGMNMGTENRVAMVFQKPFWLQAPQVFRPIIGRYTFLNLHSMGELNTLCAWVRPSAAKEVEKLSDEATVKDVCDTLKKLFPKGEFLPPVATAVTRWGSDPFSRGSVLYIPVGGRKSYCDWMMQPLTGDERYDEGQVKTQGRATLRYNTRLFFGGDATHKDDAGTVHGAFLTGQREAERIANWWRMHHEEILT